MGVASLWSGDLAGHVVDIWATDRDVGDVHPLRVDPPTLSTRQTDALGTRWLTADQRHGVDVVDARRGARSWPVPGVGDVLVTSVGGPAVSVWAADCAPVVLLGTEGTIVGVHAGWRGLSAGVVDAGVNVLAATGESVAAAVLGPHIHPCCYEFGEADLRRVAGGVDASTDAIRGSTAWRTTALDVAAAVRAGLGPSAAFLTAAATCTGCDTRWFSHRVRRESERHAVVVTSRPAH